MVFRTMGRIDTRDLVWLRTSNFTWQLWNFCDADGRAETKKLTSRTGKAGDVHFGTWRNGMTGHPIVVHRDARKRALSAAADVQA